MFELTACARYFRHTIITNRIISWSLIKQATPCKLLHTVIIEIIELLICHFFNWTRINSLFLPRQESTVVRSMSWHFILIKACPVPKGGSVCVFKKYPKHLNSLHIFLRGLFTISKIIYLKIILLSSVRTS